MQLNAHLLVINLGILMKEMIKLLRYWCFIEGSWKESDVFSKLEWFCFLSNEGRQSMGDGNLRKSLTSLYAEVESLVWTMWCI